MLKLPQPKQELSFWEFVALMAMMSSLAALSTDAMLPALAEIGGDLGVLRDNSNQLIVSLLFLGMAGGQILPGAVTVVPLPGAVLLLGSALGGMALVRRRAA